MARHPVMPGAEAWSAPGEGERARIGVAVVHGFTGNPATTRPFGEALAARGFRVEVPRLPGHGTHWRDMMRTTYYDWIGAVLETHAQLAKDTDHVFLVGLSMGGTLVLDAASRRSSEVSGVVPINAPILDREGIVAKLAPFLERIFPVVPAAAAGLAKNDAAREGVDERAYPMVPARAGNSLLVELPRIRRALRDLHVPTLVAYSPSDHSVPPENSREILRLVEGAEDLVLPRSYHLATLDYDRELLEERVATFIERVVA